MSISRAVRGVPGKALFPSRRRHNFVRRNRRDPSQLNDVQIEILEAVGCWYNGSRFWSLDGEHLYGISQTSPPEIETLVRVLHDVGEDEYESIYAPAFGDLFSDGWVRSEHILRERIAWDPRREAREFLDDHLAEGPYNDLVPPWLNRDHGRGLAGGLTETLMHRTGVEVARRSLKETGHTEIEVYPGDGGRGRCDIHSIHPDGTKWATEILTRHHDIDAYRDKYAFTSDQDRRTLYVFQARDLANHCLNWWVEDDDLRAEVVNFPLKNPEDRAMKHIKDYVRRSCDSDDYATPGIQDIDTVTRLFDQYCSGN